MEETVMAGGLRDLFDGRDVAGLVSRQVDDVRVGVMVESPVEVARFALMLVHEAQGRPRPGEPVLVVAGSDVVASEVLVESRVDGVVVDRFVVPFEVFAPVGCSSMWPLMSAVVESLLGLGASPVLAAA